MNIKKKYIAGIATGVILSCWVALAVDPFCDREYVSYSIKRRKR